MPSLRKKNLGLSKPLGDAMVEALEHSSSNYYHEEIPLRQVRVDPDNLRTMIIRPEDIRPFALTPDSGPEDRSSAALEIMERPLEQMLPRFAEEPAPPAVQEEYRDLQELAASILAVGVVQAIRTYRHGDEYVIIAGERRYLASLMAGRGTILSQVFQDAPDRDTLRATQYIENYHRAPLSVADEIAGQASLVRLMATEHGGRPDAKTVQQRLGVSASTAYRAIRFARAPDDVIATLRDKHIPSLNVADRIIREHNESLRDILIAKASGCSNEKEALSAIDAAVDSWNAQAAASPSMGDEPEKGGGSPLRKASLGKLEPSGLTRIIRAVLQAPEFSRYQSIIDLEKVDESDPKMVQKAWKQLIQAIQNDIDE